MCIILNIHNLYICTNKFNFHAQYVQLPYMLYVQHASIHNVCVYAQCACSLVLGSIWVMITIILRKWYHYRELSSKL